MSMPPQTAPTRLRLSVLAHLAGCVAGVALGAWAVMQHQEWPETYIAACLVALLPVAWLALTRLQGHGHGAWGHANRVTLLRAGLLALLAGMLPFTPAIAADALWLPALIAVAALGLDGVDGWLARRQGLASAYGARFDMEVDTLAILVLALLLWRTGEVGAWVLALALPRPLFVLAARIRPWLSAPLPPSQRRRVICMLQVAVLAFCLTPVVGPPLTGFAVGAALALLLFSFAVDTVWLESRRDNAGGTNNG
ncbi:CDP-alcohol phosphatidyltransferase family protein [Niveispirillum fermenti]|uniref:CDP-alcohol phosphatidyltransferase family protein n=1 Tax=Niveispirillum fermenti TaxID=1233113 RepID=UPI003A866957